MLKWGIRCDGPVSELFWSVSSVRLLLNSQPGRHTPLDMGLPHKKHCEIHNPCKHAHEHASMSTMTQTNLSTAAVQETTEKTVLFWEYF